MSIPKRPDYGDATPEDLARALLRPVEGREPEPPPDDEDGSAAAASEAAN